MNRTSMREALLSRLPDALPTSVQQGIREHQQEGERLICYAQMILAGLLLLLYVVLPAPVEPKGLPFEDERVRWLVVNAIPISLLPYMAFAAFRWWLLRKRASDALALISVFLDVAVLLVVVWSFHFKYGAPSDMGLKAPTTWYLFMFIALRMLRFEPRYVITAGIAAAIGWALFSLVTMAQPEIELTHNFNEYFWPGKLMIGTEVDHVIAILAVTGVLVVAQGRARSTLIRAVQRRQAVDSLSRFFTPEIASRISGSGGLLEPGRGEVRRAAILNVDLRGFTPLSQRLKPDDAMALLVEYQSRVVPVIKEHGGSIDKFLGDGILATFGAAAESETYAADSLRAVRGILKAADSWNEERAAAGQERMRIGASVASGPVLFGTVGDPQRLEWTVIGNAVNLSAKLEKQTKAEQVTALCDASTYELALEQGLDAGDEERRDDRSVGGVDEPTDLVVLG